MKRVYHLVIEAADYEGLSVGLQITVSLQERKRIKKKKKKNKMIVLTDAFYAGNRFSY